jgi:hypothetical protein
VNGPMLRTSIGKVYVAVEGAKSTLLLQHGVVAFSSRFSKTSEAKALSMDNDMARERPENRQPQAHHR